MNIGLIGNAIGGIMQGLDGLFTSDEERLQAKNVIMGVQAQVMGQVLDYEKAALQAQSDIIKAEATGQSWLQRNWRPLTMVVFVGIIVAKWFGFTDNSISEELEMKLMSIIQLGIGGYIVGRSGEKIVKSIDFGKIKAKD